MKLWAMCLKCRFEYWDDGVVKNAACPECQARHIVVGEAEPSDAVKAKMLEDVWTKK